MRQHIYNSSSSYHYYIGGSGYGIHLPLVSGEEPSGQVVIGGEDGWSGDGCDTMVLLLLFQVMKTAVLV
jgi:hypothetical protein